MSAVPSTREIGPQWRSDIEHQWRVDLADAIARTVQQRALTTAQVAKICGWSDQTEVRRDLGLMRDRFKGGESNPGITRLLRYAHYLKVPVSQNVVHREVAA